MFKIVVQTTSYPERALKPGDTIAFCDPETDDTIEYTFEALSRITENLDPLIAGVIVKIDLPSGGGEFAIRRVHDADA